jgi:XTP/dITP diphosphohydrolase
VTDLLLASDNPGKLAELRALLPPEIIVKALGDFGLPAPAETGSTIAENSAIKAVETARASRFLTLADDSGLEVDALGGRPGVHSKRFAGETGDDSANIDRLIHELESVPDHERTASFVCVLTLAGPDGVLASATGRLHGRIGTERRGNNGFGYDPIFYIEDGRTIAELSPAEKNAISHRGRALREILPALLIAIGTNRFSTTGAGQ